MSPLPLGLYPTARRTMLPFDWHAEDLTLTARSGQTSSLTRASDSGLAAFQDASGLVGYAARNAVRWHRDPATGLIGLLAENAITNLTKQASDVTQSPWVCRGTATPAKTLTGPDGVANSATVMTGVGQSGVNDFYQIVSKTAADGTRNEPCLWFYRVTTTGTVRFQNQQNITNGWWDIDLSKLAAGWNYLTRWHVAVTVNVDFSIKSNATGPQFSTGAAAGPVSFGLFNVQVPDTTVTTPSSPVPTGSSTATRQNDSNINWTFNGGTGLLSLLLEFIETGSVFGTGNYMLAMGTGAVYAGFRNHSGSNKYQGFHTNGGSSAAVDAAAAPAVGDRVRLRLSIYTDGHIDFGQTINSGAEAVTSDATVAGRAAFGSNRLAANVTDFGPPPGAALIRRVAADYAIRTGSSFAEAA